MENGESRIATGQNHQVIIAVAKKETLPNAQTVSFKVEWPKGKVVKAECPEDKTFNLQKAIQLEIAKRYQNRNAKGLKNIQNEIAIRENCLNNNNRGQNLPKRDGQEIKVQTSKAEHSR